MDIEKLAYKAGAYIEECTTTYPKYNRIIFDDKSELQAFTNEVIEECAKECNKLAWSHKNTPMLGPEINSLKCEEAIRKLKVGTL